MGDYDPQIGVFNADYSPRELVIQNLASRFSKVGLERPLAEGGSLCGSLSKPLPFTFLGDPGAIESDNLNHNTLAAAHCSLLIVSKSASEE